RARHLVQPGNDLKPLLPGPCLSRPYQRPSPTAPGDAAEDRHFRRMAVKPLGPETLFDSLAVVAAADKSAPSARPADSPRDLAEAREQFVRFFRAQNDGGDAAGLNQGIRQALRLLNGPLLNGAAPVVEGLAARNVKADEAVEALFLVAYARRPTPAERELSARYLAKQPSARDGYAGLLWALLN